MTRKQVVIRTDIHEEQFDVEVNGESIAHFCYDTHGSSGMQDARRLVKRLGLQFGFDVIEKDAADDA